MDSVKEFEEEAKNSEDTEFGKNEMTAERQKEGWEDILDKIEAEQAKIDANNEEAKEANAPHRDTIAKLKLEAREDFAVEASVISLRIAERKAERRHAARVDNLKPSAREQYDLFTA